VETGMKKGLLPTTQFDNNNPIDAEFTPTELLHSSHQPPCRERFPLCGWREL
jgi:hypothetical protein